MINRKLRISVCLISVMVILFSGLSVFSYAETLTVVKQPDQKTYYQGIDWAYTPENTISIIHQPKLNGTVISNGTKQVTYKETFNDTNMYCLPSSGSWIKGNNTIKIYCDDFSGYATTTINFAYVNSIELVTPPTNTYFVKGVDWKPGPYGDVEFTSCNLSGLTLKVTYSDKTVKTVSSDSNALIGWSVAKGTSYILPGDATLYATFCGKSVPFNVVFANSNPYQLGDATKDGFINSHDALVILQHSTGIITLDTSSAALADVNKDSNINSFDALMVLQYSVGIINKF